MKVGTRDLAPKAKVLRCPATTMHYHISRGGTSVGGWHISEGVAFQQGGTSLGRLDFGPYLVDGGSGIHGGGGGFTEKPKLCKTINHGGIKKNYPPLKKPPK